MRWYFTNRSRRVRIVGLCVSLIAVCLGGSTAVAVAHDPTVDYVTCQAIANKVHDDELVVSSLLEGEIVEPAASAWIEALGTTAGVVSECAHRAGSMGIYIIVASGASIVLPDVTTEAEACRQIVTPYWSEGNPHANRGMDILCMIGMAVHNRAFDPNYLPTFRCIDVTSEHREVVILPSTSLTGGRHEIFTAVWVGQGLGVDLNGPYCNDVLVGQLR